MAELTEFDKLAANTDADKLIQLERDKECIASLTTRYCAVVHNITGELPVGVLPTDLLEEMHYLRDRLRELGA